MHAVEIGRPDVFLLPLWRYRRVWLSSSFFEVYS